jgi:hypothetical protein
MGVARMFGPDSVVALTALLSMLATPGADSLTPRSLGVGCQPDTHMTREVGPDGKPYMSAFGKAICNQVGPGEVTAVLYRNNKEVTRKTVESLNTSYISSVTTPCVDGPTTANWAFIAEYSDDYIGQTVQHVFLENYHCS